MVFITGFSGRFPSSDNVHDFWTKLCEGQDLVACIYFITIPSLMRNAFFCTAQVTETTRHPKDYFNLPGHQAEIKEISKFDAMFFGISANQANCLDPQIRLLLGAFPLLFPSSRRVMLIFNIF